MSVPAQAYEQYSGAKGPEWLLRIGDPAAAPVLFIAPLFEEMNRTRALIVATMRALAADGHCCWLPDLTGTGESLVSLDKVGWNDWRHDVTSAAQHVTNTSGPASVSVAIRGGCLLDDALDAPHWRFAPIAGVSLARDLDRASLGGGAEWAGYADASPALRTALAEATPAPADDVRVVRLATDAGAADLKVEGPALWRRSEPGNSIELAAALAQDIAAWRRICAAS